MEYFVIEITKYNDGTKDAYGIYAKDTETEAVQLFHQKLSGAMKASNISFELCQVINNYGVVVKTEYYENATPEPSEGE